MRENIEAKSNSNLEVTETLTPVSIPRVQHANPRFVASSELLVGDYDPKRHELIGLLETRQILANGQPERIEERMIFAAGNPIYTADINDIGSLPDDAAKIVHERRKQKVVRVLVAPNAAIFPIGEHDVVKSDHFAHTIFSHHGPDAPARITRQVPLHEA